MIKEKSEIWAKGIIKELVNNYNRLGLRASGDWERGLEYTVEQKQDLLTIKFLGFDYTQFMEFGRRMNKDQSPEGLRKFVGYAGSTFLEKWVKDKGLSISPFAVAYKIAREGVKVPNTFNKGGLVSDIINLDSVREFTKQFTDIYVDEIKTELKDGNN